MEECSRFDQYWFPCVYPAEEVSGEFKDLGSGQYQNELKVQNIWLWENSDGSEKQHFS